MKKIIILMLFCVGLFAADASITIYNNGQSSLPKVIVQDASNIKGNSLLRDNFFRLMVGDLMVGAVFDVNDQYFTSSYAGDYKTNIAKNANLIVRYDFDASTGLKVKVLDARNGKILFNQSYHINDPARYPFLAHKAISEIVKNLGYSNVDWMNKMVIISTQVAPRQDDILVADYTLTYKKIIISGGINIFPRWANESQNAFYFTTFVNKTPTLYRYDLSNGTRTKILSSNGMIVCSDVSSDGDKLVLTMAPNDQPDIYIYDIKTGGLTRVTTYSGIDVSGNFINNDSSIAFVSDRLGSPNIFAKSINGGVVRQMVFKGKNNSALSTCKDFIVYSSREDNNPSVFNLYLISTDTDYVRQLTNGGANLFPRFSSDCGSILFIKYLPVGSAIGIIRINENKSFQFPLSVGKIQSLDW